MSIKERFKEHFLELKADLATPVSKGWLIWVVIGFLANIVCLVYFWWASFMYSVGEVESINKRIDNIYQNIGEVRAVQMKEQEEKYLARIKKEVELREKGKPTKPKAPEAAKK